MKQIILFAFVDDSLLCFKNLATPFGSTFLYYVIKG